ncbi:MAG TPA: SufE family protein [Microbacterium sp.]|nr:SufE family protein [Microbacterium sp.]
MTDAALPQPLAEIRDEFLELDAPERLELLLEYADDLPDVPDDVDADGFERVAECQSPVFIALQVADGVVTMHAKAPAEAPTTRGFAGILVRALTGLPAAEALRVPDEFPQSLGLTQSVSPLRIAGMSGMLRRAKRQIAAQSAA